VAETLSIEVIPEERLDEVLKETYRDPEAARGFFERGIAEREGAVARFAEEVNQSPDMVEATRQRPIEMLRERGLLGPLDDIRIRTLNPELNLWWPWPICRWECRWVVRTVIEWVCIGWGPFRICFPRLRFVLSWECRIVCF
jgi:hypothetical protein